MVPDHLRFGGGVGDTAIQPFMAVYLVLAVLFILILPRGKVILPFLIAFFTIPISQVVVLGGLHFTALRIMILAGLARRIAFQGSTKYPGGFNSVDRWAVLFTTSSIVVFCLQFRETAAIITGLGDLVDMLGGYMVIRFLIPDGEAMRRAIKALAVVCLIESVCMIGERVIHINAFGYLGGMPIPAAVRDDKIRAAGSLGALTAGPFAGVLFPVFLWFVTERSSRKLAYMALAAATAMVITSNSSTSWMAIGGSLLGLAFWRFRARMRQIRWALVITLVGLHLWMKAPVWALIARIDLTGASSGWQRYFLVDMTIRHFWDWWLMGTTDYVNWGWGAWDTCNQFVDVALKGGLITLVFYIAILKSGFATLGRTRKLVNGDRKQEWLLWCLGSSLLATIVAAFGINYMAQLIMSFFALVSLIQVASFEAKRSLARTEALSEKQYAPVVANTVSYVAAGESNSKVGIFHL